MCSIIYKTADLNIRWAIEQTSGSVTFSLGTGGWKLLWVHTLQKVHKIHRGKRHPWASAQPWILPLNTGITHSGGWTNFCPIVSSFTSVAKGIIFAHKPCLSTLLLRKQTCQVGDHVGIMVIYLEKERFVILSSLLQNCFLITFKLIALSCHNKLWEQVERLIIVGFVLVSYSEKILQDLHL